MSLLFIELKNGKEKNRTIKQILIFYVRIINAAIVP